MLKLKIDGLSCSIKSKEILKDITVSFQQGEMAAVLGRNGAGKTTFPPSLRQVPHALLTRSSLVRESKLSLARSTCMC